MPSNSCIFNHDWVEKPEWKDWLSDSKGNKHAAFCRACKKTFDIRVMGEAALRSHAKGIKHKKLVKASEPAVRLTEFISASSATASTERESEENTGGSTNSATPVAVVAVASEPVASTVGLSTPIRSIAKQFQSSDVLKAEILHTLHVVQSHLSFRSCEATSRLFAAMFPTCDVAKMYACGETKTRYLATFGLAPYFVDLLKKSVRGGNGYVLLFDETLNKNLKLKQLDIHVRLWQEEKVVSQYLTSEFLGHARANDILQKLSTTVSELGYGNLLQLSMDGPNVNWKVSNVILLEYVFFFFNLIKTHNLLLFCHCYWAPYFLLLLTSFCCSVNVKNY